MVVYEKSKETQELEGMGTTLEVCLIYNNKVNLNADVAELADAPDLGSGAFGVQVRLLSSAPAFNVLLWQDVFLCPFYIFTR